MSKHCGEEKTPMNEIVFDLRVDNVCDLCELLNSFDFDTNVIYGRKCVDGKSIMGLMAMCGHSVVLTPVTSNKEEIKEYIKKICQLNI